MSETISIVSGGFDPVHKGHVRMFRAAKNNSDRLIVIVNSDNFLLEKKGFLFMSLDERKEILRDLGTGLIDKVVSAIDTDQTVCKTLEVIRDFYYDYKLLFCNGGDRTEANIAEAETCNRLGIEMVFGIGGDKVQSSSELIKRMKA